MAQSSAHVLALASLALVAALACCHSTAAASDVVTLTASNFKSKVLDSNEFWLVEFYAPWCGHCKQLAPTWEQAATVLKSNAKLGAVDATVHSALAQQYGVRGYPTIKVFGKNKKDPADYQGARDLDAITAYVRQSAKGFSVGPKVRHLSYTDMHNYVKAGSSSSSSSSSKGARFVVLEAGGKAGNPPKWFTSLSAKIAAKAKGTQFAHVTKGHAKKVARRLQLESLPAILGISADGSQYAVQLASGKRFVPGDVKQFVKGFLKQTLELKPLPAFPPPEGPKGHAKLKLIQNLSADNFKSKCIKRKGAMCVMLLPQAGAGAADVTALHKDMTKPLAKRFRLDKFVFAAVQDADVAAALRQHFGLDAAADHLVVLRTGKRTKFAAYDITGSSVDAAAQHLDNIASGSARFASTTLPELQQEQQEEAEEQQQEQEAEL